MKTRSRPFMLALGAACDGRAEAAYRRRGRPRTTRCDFRRSPSFAGGCLGPVRDCHRAVVTYANAGVSICATTSFKSGGQDKCSARL